MPINRSFHHVWHSEVRDYELDFQGIVNNAAYINYLEQCRSHLARKLGINVHELHRQGLDLIPEISPKAHYLAQTLGATGICSLLAGTNYTTSELKQSIGTQAL